MSLSNKESLLTNANVEEITTKKRSVYGTHKKDAVGDGN